MGKIKKTEVIRGVYWVEIPDADIYLLCGTPEDAIKHLMRLRLIQRRQRDGVTYESGPNTILLSDVSLQNGKLCNLAEFPVLQMLYRQGMLIPGHPNNTGAKPLLVGSRAQVESQMQYISRGNYGLTSAEEIAAAGETGERADLIMRMKLWFAFGEILPSEELLDHRIVGDTAVELRNGVSIRRDTTNVFTLMYEDEKVEIDLTVKRGRNDRSPYPLGFQSIPRDYFSVVHSGQGDGWDYNRPCMASVLIYQGRVFLVDAGPNTAYGLTALGIGVNEIDGIFHTHCHDDHFAGMTSLMRSDRRIRYYATPLVRDSVFKKLSALLSISEEDVASYFDVRDLTFDEWNNIDGLEVMPVLSPHPVENSVFFFRAFWESRYLTYAHLADIASFDVMNRMITDDDKAPGMSRSVVEEVRKIYLTPVDLKKVDIGGGMIHGEVEDFESDESDKIILAHRSEPLTNKQKEIGSSAPFGVVDTLIPDTSDNLRRFAFEYLRAAFPEVARHDLRTLLNNPIVEFTPGEIILRKTRVPQYIYLVITGTVEKIRAEDDIYNIISSGGLIGEHAGINDLPCESAYRTVNFARALQIPLPAYLEVVNRSNLHDMFNDRAAKRAILDQFWLFGESVSPAVQNAIAETMVLHEVGAGTEIDDLPGDCIFILEDGSIEQVRDGHVSDVIGPRGFFGEEQVLFGMNGSFVYRTTEASRFYEIPGSAVTNVPIVRWKMLEAYEYRSIT
ncbi:MAG: cyclic nucleotide-binding domain-containing protein [Rhodospirillales bacterium]